MFGLFGKSGFDSEMEKLEKEHKALGAELITAMQRFDLMGQMRIIDSQLDLYARRIECCNRYGKFDISTRLESERNRLKELRG